MDRFSNLIDIHQNYTRGELCDLLGLDYMEIQKEIEQGLFKPKGYSSIILFSTIDNFMHYFNCRIDNQFFLFASRSKRRDLYLIQHKYTNHEALLFVRLNAETGFYYFGRCEYQNKCRVKNSFNILYKLLLIDTDFSHNEEIDIPICNKEIIDF